MIDRIRSAFDDAPIEHPLCPAHCCFRRYCVLTLQRDAVLHVFGSNKPRETCTQFQVFARILRRDFGVEEPPETTQDLDVVLEERHAIYAESAEYEAARRADDVAAEAGERARLEASFATMPTRIRGQGIKTDAGTSRPPSEARAITVTDDPFADQLTREVERIRIDQRERERQKREQTTGQQELVL